MTDLFSYPHQPGARARDTSRAAAKSARTRDIPLRELCLDFLSLCDATADEVATVLGESVLAIRPRITQLNKLGKIEDSGQRRKNESGREAIVWTKVKP